MSIRTICAAFALAAAGSAVADTTPHNLGLGNFSQDWTTTTLITADNNWSGVPSIIGYRGDDLTTSTGTDPQTILADGAATPVNVEANETNPNVFATGGVAEFDGIANPTIALNGSGTADAPHIVIRLNTTGREDVQVIYTLRDLDGSGDNAVMPVALQYRVGASGAFTNVPAGFVADATTGPNLATQTTLVSAALPIEAEDQAVVDVRIITANAVGNDEWVGIDDLIVFGNPIPPTLVFDPVAGNEGNAGNTTFTFAITKTSAAAATVQVATSSDTATGGNPGPGIDFQEIRFNADQQVSFPAGISTQNVSVTVFGDTEVEPDETFELVVFQPTSSSLEGINEYVRIPATIRNDDGLTPTVSVGDVSVVEGSGVGTTTASFVVSISALPAADSTVSFATTSDSAISDTDFTASSGTLTFTPSGGLTRVVEVPITRDSIDEDDETFLVDLSAPAGLSIADGQGVGTILDDDTATLSIANLSQLEGTGGSTNFAFTASLSTSASTPRTFVVTTSDGSAAAPGDYTAITPPQNQTITFAPGDTTQTFNVSVVADALVEGDETFNVQLQPPQVQNPSATAIGTILNDDRELSIGNATVVEGTGPGSTNAVFTVTLSGAPAVGQNVTVDFATAGASATSGVDFTATSGTLTFTSNGGLTQTLSVPITRDDIDEPNEGFSVTLSNAVNATLVGANGAGSITDDDNPPTVSLNSRALNEGNSGTTTFDFTATLSNPSATPLQYTVYTQNGTAIAPGDYTAIGCCVVQLTFPPLSTVQTVNVSVLGDTAVEPDETFSLVLAAGAIPPGPDGLPPPLATGIGTILNDDVSRELTISDASVIEGTGAGSSNVVFTVSLSNAPAVGQDVSVNYATASGSALSGTDFTATTGTLTFTSGGALTQTISVPVTRDTIDESDETFAITLSAPVNATIVDGSGVGTITDDDTAVVSVASISQPEGTGGTTAFTFTATLSVPSSSNRVFALTTADGSATAPADYQAIASGAQSVTLVAGATSQTFSVQVVGDTQPEADETFTVTLTPTSPEGNNASATATIVNDDVPVVSIANAQVTEGTGSNATLNFTVSLSSPALAAVSVSFATSNGSATAPADYTAATGTVNFSAGQQTRPVAVTVIGDPLVEPDETFQVTLSAPVGATLGNATATGTIVNDDNAALSINDITLPEGTGGGTTPFVFTITSSAPSSTPISVNFATSPMSATSPDDFAAASGTATIPAGATSTTVTTNVVADAILESNEQFTVTLSAPVGATLADPTGIGTIINDDQPVAIPTLDRHGLLALLLAMLGVGMLVLRPRD